MMHYNTSNDYEKLWELVVEQGIEIVAYILAYKHHSYSEKEKSSVILSKNNITYIVIGSPSILVKEEYLRCCEAYSLEWIVPQETKTKEQIEGQIEHCKQQIEKLGQRNTVINSLEESSNYAITNNLRNMMHGLKWVLGE